jgi:hypothetical protein
MRTAKWRTTSSYTGRLNSTTCAGRGRRRPGRVEFGQPQVQSAVRHALPGAQAATAQAPCAAVAPRPSRPACCPRLVRQLLHVRPGPVAAPHLVRQLLHVPPGPLAELGLAVAGEVDLGVLPVELQAAQAGVVWCGVGPQARRGLCLGGYRAGITARSGQARSGWAGCEAWGRQAAAGGAQQRAQHPPARQPSILCHPAAPRPKTTFASGLGTSASGR